MDRRKPQHRVAERSGGQYYFPDEEPEDPYPFHDYSGLCSFCGHADHDGERCPVRPLPKG